MSRAGQKGETVVKQTEGGRSRTTALWRWILAAAVLVSTGCADLHEAALEGDTERIRSLLGQGNVVDVRDENGRTPLMAAARTNNIASLRLLLANGAEPDLTDRSGKTALWYAYDQRNFEAFRMLLESGARADFLDARKTPPRMPKQRNLYDLAKELDLLRRIRATPGEISLYDIYFSRFPGGYYLPQVDAQLRRQVREDFAQIRKSPDRELLTAFLKKYGDLGGRAHRVVASQLNIRAWGDLAADLVGQYVQGDVVFAVARKGDWVLTDLGWVHGDYLRRIDRPVAATRPYVKAVRDRLAKAGEISPPPPRPERRPLRTLKPRRTKPASVAAPAPAPAAASPPAPASTPAPSARSGAGSGSGPEAELSAILADPTLQALEGFIKKYDGRKGHAVLVRRAREAYRTLLLHGN